MAYWGFTHRSHAWVPTVFFSSALWIMLARIACDEETYFCGDGGEKCPDSDAQQMLYEELYRAGYHRSPHETRASSLLHLIIEGRHQVEWENFSWPKLVKQNTSILDVGCSNGVAVKQLRDAGFVNARGVDISETAVRMARNLTKCDDCFQQANAKKLPFEDNSFDAMFSSDMLEDCPRGLGGYMCRDQPGRTKVT